MKNKKILLIIPAILIAVTLCLYSFAFNKNEEKSDTFKVPVLGNSPNMEVNDISFEDLTKMSDLVFYGEVTQNPVKESSGFSLVPGSPEYKIDQKKKDMGMSGIDLDLYHSKIKVIDVFKGTPSAGEIDYYQSTISADFEPVLENGGKMIFFVTKDKDNKYSVIHPHASYFYVDNDKAYPAFRKLDYDKMDGITLKGLKEKVKKAKDK